MIEGIMWVSLGGFAVFRQYYPSAEEHDALRWRWYTELVIVRSKSPSFIEKIKERFGSAR